MKAWVRIGLTGGGIVLGSAAAYFFVRAAMDEQARADVENDEQLQPASRIRVLQRANADGVRPELQALLDLWNVEGTHDVQVSFDGGLRTDAVKQLDFFNRGLSKAKFLTQTPHGRGAALDIAPAGILTAKQRADRYRVFGAWAESKGFVWGGRWTALFVDGDQPHIELPHWRSLPIPSTALAGFLLTS